MLKVEKDYTFTGPKKDGTFGTLSLKDLFDCKRQLIMYQFMWSPEAEKPCHGCSFLVDQMPTHLGVLRDRNTNFVMVSRAPYEKLATWQKRMGWPQSWYSSYGSDFNYDYYGTLDSSVKPVLNNFRTKEEHEALRGYSAEGEQAGFSIFLMGDDGEIYYTYACYGRGDDHLLVTLGLLDFTPLGRQFPGREPPGGAKYHDEFAD